MERLPVPTPGDGSELYIDPLSVYFVNSVIECDSLNNVAECDSVGSSSRNTPVCNHSNDSLGNFIEEVSVLLENYVVEPHQAIMDSTPKKTDCYPTVKGRLRQHARFWRDVLQSSPFVMRIIEEGYRLPFYTIPTHAYFSNHASAKRECAFVEQELNRLLREGCVEEVQQVPSVCSPLSVVTSAAGKKRLVHDLRHVNLFLWKERFKYEDMRTALEMIEVGDYMVSFDLKAGYHHIDIHRDHWQYLGFSWEHDGAKKYYVFKVLPFGLSTACYVFTKVMRQLVKKWRGMGIRIVVYIDDGIAFASTAKEASRVAQLIREDLEAAGWILNREKTRLEPFRTGIWLGLELNLSDGVLSVPGYRVKKLTESLEKLVKEANDGKIVGVRALASTVGQIISMKLAVGNIVRLMTRECYAQINTCMTWADRILLKPEVISELEFWLSSHANYNGTKIRPGASAVRMVFSDASDVAYGGYMVGIGNEIAHENWTPEEGARSSTWRELAAVERMLKIFASKLAGTSVHWFTDNQAVTRIVEVGSRKRELQTLALSIFRTCTTGNISDSRLGTQRSKSNGRSY